MPDSSERLGCPACRSLDLSIGMICFEPIEIFTDGHVEHNQGITDYGPTVTIECDDCNWHIGARDFPRVSIEAFVTAHADLIRSEFIKEVQAS